MKINFKTDKLWKQIKEELNEDLFNRYDGEWDSWSEAVLDCPSKTLEGLLGRIPQKHQESYYEMMSKHIHKLRDE